MKKQLITIVVLATTVMACSESTEHRVETVGDSIETKAERLGDTAAAKWERLEDKVENRFDSLGKDRDRDTTDRNYK